jgi:hypothetical protein
MCLCNLVFRLKITKWQRRNSPRGDNQYFICAYISRPNYGTEDSPCTQISPFPLGQRARALNFRYMQFLSSQHRLLHPGFCDLLGPDSPFYFQCPITSFVCSGLIVATATRRTLDKSEGLRGLKYGT